MEVVIGKVGAVAVSFAVKNKEASIDDDVELQLKALQSQSLPIHLTLRFPSLPSFSCIILLLSLVLIQYDRYTVISQIFAKYRSRNRNRKSLSQTKGMHNAMANTL